MKKQIVTIIFTIFFLNLISANVIYGGEYLLIPLGYSDLNYFVVGNSSDLEGMNITFKEGVANVSFAINYKPDTFTIVFLGNETKEIVKEVKVGGGSRTIVKKVEKECDTCFTGGRITEKDLFDRLNDSTGELVCEKCPESNGLFNEDTKQKINLLLSLLFVVLLFLVIVIILIKKNIL